MTSYVEAGCSVPTAYPASSGLGGSVAGDGSGFGTGAGCNFG